MTTPQIHAPPQTMRRGGAFVVPPHFAAALLWRSRDLCARKRGRAVGAYWADQRNGRYSPRSGGSSSSDLRPPSHHRAALCSAAADDDVSPSSLCESVPDGLGSAVRP